MVAIGIDPELSTQVPFLRLGALAVDDLQNGPATAPLSALIRATESQTAAALKLEEISGLPAIAGWRRVMKALGTDPARYRVSSERLLRRVVKGEGLPQINLLVDLINVWSVVSGLPVGLYDRDQLAGSNLTFGVGQPEERYLTLTGTELETRGKPVLRDSEGPVGSPLTDSIRTATGPGTSRCLAVIFAPPLYPNDEFTRHQELLADWIAHFTTGRIVAREAAIG